MPITAYHFCQLFESFMTDCWIPEYVQVAVGLLVKVGSLWVSNWLYKSS